MLKTPEDFLKLVNAVARVVKPDFEQDISSIDTPFVESGLDSLDGLLTCMYICEIYGVPEEAAKNWHPVSIREVYDFILQHKTKEPETLEEALEYIQ